MLKRTLILLALAGGMAVSVSLPNAVHAEAPMAYAAQSNDFPSWVIQRALEEAAPHFGMSYSDAYNHYQDGAITIDVEEENDGNTILRVSYGGSPTLILIEDYING